MKRVLWVTALVVIGLGLVGWLALRPWLSIESVPEPTLGGALLSAALEHEGRTRSYQLYEPLEREAAPALVLVLHGSQGDSGQARGGFGYEWDRLADRDGFLVAYPDGFDRHWNGCRRAGPYRANREDVDDVGFLLALVDALATSHGVDPRRIFATGISNGGHMVLRLALEAPARFRAVAPVIASLPAGNNMDCTAAGRPVSLLLMNGTEDPMNPYEGGRVALFGFGDRGDVLSTEATARYWAELAGYDEPPAVERLPDVAPDDGSTIERWRWRERGRPSVELVAVIGGGHTVPHPEMRMPRLLGETNADARAAELIWEFFRTAP